MAASPQTVSLLGRRSRLALDEMLATLVVDGYLLAEDAKQVRMGTRSGRATVELHPLVLVANVKLPNQRDPGRPLSLEVLTEWLAGHAQLPYLKIDPMKINVAAVTQVVSRAYAERHRILPVAAATGEVTFATCEPFDTRWTADLVADPTPRHQARRLQPDRHRPLPAGVVRRTALDPAGAGRQDHRLRFLGHPQLRAVGRARQERRTRRRRSPRRAHRGLAAAVRVRAARLGHPSRTAPRSRPDPFSHRRRHAQGVRTADAGDDRRDRAHQDPLAHGRGRKASPAGWPHQDALAARDAKWNCASRACRPRSARRS